MAVQAKCVDGRPREFARGKPGSEDRRCGTIRGRLLPNEARIITCGFSCKPRGAGLSAVRAVAAVHAFARRIGLEHGAVVAE